jgi:hypothetical protein
VATVSVYAPQYDCVTFGGGAGVNGWGHPNEWLSGGTVGSYGVTGRWSIQKQRCASTVSMWGSCFGGICNTPSFQTAPPGLDGTTGSGSFAIFVSGLLAGDYAVAVHFTVLATTTCAGRDSAGAAGHVRYWGADANGRNGWQSVDFAARQPGGDNGDLLDATVTGHITVHQDGERVRLAEYLLENMNHPADPTGINRNARTKATGIIEILSVQPDLP